MLENSFLATKIFVLSAIAKKLAEPYQGLAAILDYELWEPWAEKISLATSVIRHNIYQRLQKVGGDIELVAKSWYLCVL